VTNLAPEHISFYSVQLEEGTPFFRMFERGELDMVSDEEDRAMYHRAIALLKESGYTHYEISNAAKPGFECRHNMKYWNMDEFIGLGLGASSFFGGARYKNTDSLTKYKEVFGSGAAGEGVPACETAGGSVPVREALAEYHLNTREDDVEEFMFTGLRKTAGISLADFRERFGAELTGIYKEAMPAIREYEREGLLEFADGYMRLTEKGIDVSNAIMAEFVGLQPKSGANC
jgi:oxygen-independent coproporphyrinogen-3 oxidase